MSNSPKLSEHFSEINYGFVKSQDTFVTWVISLSTIELNYQFPLEEHPTVLLEDPYNCPSYEWALVCTFVSCSTYTELLQCKPLHCVLVM